jgi:serine/threonine-protein kinase
LSREKRFIEDEAIDLILQLVSALGHAHSLGLVHRDVKPKNIMINMDGVVKLADMGLARETSDVKAAEDEKGKAFGTPYYIAPEQIRGLTDIDGRADIYALGATLFHMLTGRVPFEASAPSEVMKKHLKEPLTPPDHINTALTAGVSEVIETMMAKNRDERYRNMEEVMGDLRAVRNGQPPLMARQKFNVEALEQLEEGMAIETTDDAHSEYSGEMIAKYKVWVIALGALSALLLVAVFFLLLSQGSK